MEQKHIISKEEKLKFGGQGEWVDEPDYVIFEHEGFRCLIKRIWIPEYPDTSFYFGGHLCGYVELPKTHPYFGKGFDFHFDVHGGITFCEGNDEKWVLGFDCAHSGDVVPTMEQFRKTNDRLKEFDEIFPIDEELRKFSIFNPDYRNLEYVIQECKNLAEQLKEASNE